MRESESRRVGERKKEKEREREIKRKIEGVGGTKEKGKKSQ